MRIPLNEMGAFGLSLALRTENRRLNDADQGSWAMATSITRDLGRFIAGVHFRALPSEAVRVAKLGILDTVAVLIAGRTDSAPRLLLEALEPGQGESTVLFTARRANPPDAALV